MKRSRAKDPRREVRALDRAMRPGFIQKGLQLKDELLDPTLACGIDRPKTSGGGRKPRCVVAFLRAWSLVGHCLFYPSRFSGAFFLAPTQRPARNPSQRGEVVHIRHFEARPGLASVQVQNAKGPGSSKEGSGNGTRSTGLDPRGLGLKKASGPSLKEGFPERAADEPGGLLEELLRHCLKGMERAPFLVPKKNGHSLRLEGFHAQFEDPPQDQRSLSLQRKLPGDPEEAREMLVGDPPEGIGFLAAKLAGSQGQMHPAKGDDVPGVYAGAVNTLRVDEGSALTVEILEPQLASFEGNSRVLARNTRIEDGHIRGEVPADSEALARLERQGELSAIGISQHPSLQRAHASHLSTGILAWVSSTKRLPRCTGGIVYPRVVGRVDPFLDKITSVLEP